jgi:Family of unknown function (DUF6022)
VPQSEPEGHTLHPDIHDLAHRIQHIIDEGLAAIIPARQAEFDERFVRDGDMAYGALNTELFTPVRRLLRALSLEAKPRLPGSFSDSREWGNEDETHQQRWMWSVIRREGVPIGAIAVGSHHDHTRFRLPRGPEVVAVTGTTAGQILSQLGERMPEFAAAQPFRDWYKDYLASSTEVPGH